MFGVVVARVAMATIKKARAGFTILRSFSIRNFSTLPCTIYNTPKAKIKILKMLRIKLTLFLSPCQKSRLLETICSLQLIRQFGHFLPVFCPYLEFFSSLPLVLYNR